LVGGPLPHELGLRDGIRRSAQDGDRLVPDLVPVAVGAVEQIPSPAFAHTGISKSTLSRLKNGNAAPASGCSSRFAQAYRMPLDDLVGAPEVGDPPMRLKPRRVNGRTVLPLTQQPNGVQAWKIVHSCRPVDAEPASSRRL
jgi:hypothetical protein